MNEFNTYEFAVQQKQAGKTRLKQILFIVGMVIGFFAIFTLICIAKIFPFVAVEIFVYLPLAIFLWRFMKVEYEYSMTSGIITFSNIYDNKSKKKRFEVTIRDMKEIAPMNSQAQEHLSGVGVMKTYMMASSMDAPDLYYALFDLDGRLCVVYFEATNKALQILHFYNPSTVVTPVSR